MPRDSRPQSRAFQVERARRAAVEHNDGFSIAAASARIDRIWNDAELYGNRVVIERAAPAVDPLAVLWRPAPARSPATKRGRRAPNARELRALDLPGDEP